MNSIQKLSATILLASFFAAPLAGVAADSKSDKKAEKAKPYPLKTCVVSDEKLGGDMGEPYVFTHEGRQIKLCCKSCLKDFKKDTAKYMKKIELAEKKEQKKGGSRYEAWRFPAPVRAGKLQKRQSATPALSRFACPHPLPLSRQMGEGNYDGGRENFRQFVVNPTVALGNDR